MDYGKLIELLNEYNDNKEGVRIGFRTTVHIDGVSTPYELSKSDLLRWEDKIISKKYGFIKWLVENEKIDYKKLLENSNFIEIRGTGWGITYSLIMLLSIQDEPIKLLISLLK